MENLNQRKINEIEHGKKISSNAEKVWGHEKLAGQIRIQRRIEKMIDLGKINKKSKVLELGCGTGEFTLRIASTGAEVTGIDISPELLELAKNKLKEFSNVKFLIEDMESLSNFPENYFDCIIGNSVLHHVDYKKCLELCLKKLKIGGAIVFTEPNMMNPQIAIQKNIPFIKKIMGDSPDEIAFFRWKMRSFLVGAGYKDVKVENFDYLHPFLPDFLVHFSKNILFSLEKVPLFKEFSGSLLIYAVKK